MSLFPLFNIIFWIISEWVSALICSLSMTNNKQCYILYFTLLIYPSGNQPQKIIDIFLVEKFDQSQILFLLTYKIVSFKSDSNKVFICGCDIQKSLHLWLWYTKKYSFVIVIYKKVLICDCDVQKSLHLWLWHTKKSSFVFATFKKVSDKCNSNKVFTSYSDIQIKLIVSNQFIHKFIIVFVTGMCVLMHSY